MKNQASFKQRIHMKNQALFSSKDPLVENLLETSSLIFSEKQ